MAARGAKFESPFDLEDTCFRVYEEGVWSELQHRPQPFEVGELTRIHQHFSAAALSHFDGYRSSRFREKRVAECRDSLVMRMAREHARLQALKRGQEEALQRAEQLDEQLRVAQRLDGEAQREIRLAEEQELQIRRNKQRIDELESKFNLKKESSSHLADEAEELMRQMRRLLLEGDQLDIEGRALEAEEARFQASLVQSQLQLAQQQAPLSGALVSGWRAVRDVTDHVLGHRTPPRPHLNTAPGQQGEAPEEAYRRGLEQGVIRSMTPRTTGSKVPRGVAAMLDSTPPYRPPAPSSDPLLLVEPIKPPRSKAKGRREELASPPLSPTRGLEQYRVRAPAPPSDAVRPRAKKSRAPQPPRHKPLSIAQFIETEVDGEDEMRLNRFLEAQFRDHVTAMSRPVHSGAGSTGGYEQMGDRELDHNKGDRHVRSGAGAMGGQYEELGAREIQHKGAKHVRSGAGAMGGYEEMGAPEIQHKGDTRPLHRGAGRQYEEMGAREIQHKGDRPLIHSGAISTGGQYENIGARELTKRAVAGGGFIEESDDFTDEEITYENVDAFHANLVQPHYENLVQPHYENVLVSSRHK